MTARRILTGLALLLTATGAAGCAREIPGTGTIAADARLGPQTTAGPSPTDSPTGSPSADPSSPSASPSPSSTGGGTSAVCQALDEAALEEAFGTTVTLSRSQNTGCQVRASDGRSAIVAVFDYLTLTEYKRSGSTELSVGGHPALRTSTTIIYVARSRDPSAEGLLAAYFSGLGDEGDKLAVTMLEQLLGRYSK
jgi:hypothetical protein